MELGDYTEKEYDEMFEKVAEYLKENVGANPKKISEGSKVPLKVILKFYDEGGLMEKENTEKVADENQAEEEKEERSAPKSRSNQMTPERRRELIEALRNEYTKGTSSTNNRTSNFGIRPNSNSQLTRDLRSKYNNSRDER